MYTCLAHWQVEASGWTPPTPLEHTDLTGSADGYRENKPFLIRARVAESSTVYEITGRMELVGGIFTRTLVRHSH